MSQPQHTSQPTSPQPYGIEPAQQAPNQPAYQAPAPSPQQTHETLPPTYPLGYHAGTTAHWLPPQALPGWRPGHHQQDEELGYHRLALADPKHTWWKPLVEGPLGVVMYLLFIAVFAVGVYIALAAGLDPTMGPELLLLGNVSAITSLALESPTVFLLLFGSVALMFPALWLARLILGPRPWGLIHSVAGRMRWRWLLTCAGLAVLVYVLIPALLDLATGGTYEVSPTAQGGALTSLLVLMFIIVPIQAYAEELVFRGYLLQTLGRWLRHPAWAILLPAPLFMLAHGYDLWGQLSVLVMAVAAGYITWRTGGLEAAIALHIINNLVAMGYGIFGLADPFLQEGSSPLGLLMSIITQGIFVGLVLWLAQKQGIQRTRTATIWVPTQTPTHPPHTT